jgi:hypothetical protein
VSPRVSQRINVRGQVVLHQWLRIDDRGHSIPGRVIPLSYNCYADFAMRAPTRRGGETAVTESREQ